MNKNNFFKKTLVFTVMILFIFDSFIPIICCKINTKDVNGKDLLVSSIDEKEETTILTFYTFDENGIEQNTVKLPSDIAIEIKNLFEDLQYKIINEPKSLRTQKFKNNFISLIDEYGLLSKKQSVNQVFSILNHGWLKSVNKNLKTTKPFSNTITNSLFNGTSFLCTVSSVGPGKLIPIFMFPRPRVVSFWIASNALTYVTNEYTQDVLIAEGWQVGLLLGFIGIGLTYARPGVTLYIVIGFSLFMGVSAEYMEFYPHPSV